MGTKLGHYTGDQWNSGPHRYKVSQLRPGDLVFFFSDHHHVGIYIGHGRLIHAPKPGDVVKVASMGNSWFAGNFSGSVRPAADPPAGRSRHKRIGGVGQTAWRTGASNMYRHLPEPSGGVGIDRVLADAVTGLVARGTVRASLQSSK